MGKPKIIVVCGPTGSGKTTIAIELAQAFSGEIVGADSVQIYRCLDIGTAKPTPEQRSKVPHHMVDIIDPDETFDAARYAGMARQAISQLARRGIIPFVVGGTGFYIKALTQGLFPSRPVDMHVRERLREEARTSGSSALYQRLLLCDPDACKRIHPNDTYRIIRALEIREGTGKAMSAFHQSHGFADRPFDVLKIGLYADRDILYNRINRRVDAMIEDGLVDEVRGLLARGYAADLKSMQAIGYRHVVDFLQGRLDWEEAVRTLKRDTRRYAKRQLTWFNRDPAISWVDPGSRGEIAREIGAFLGDTPS